MYSKNNRKVICMCVCVHAIKNNNGHAFVREKKALLLIMNF